METPEVMLKATLSRKVDGTFPHIDLVAELANGNKVTVAWAYGSKVTIRPNADGNGKTAFDIYDNRNVLKTVLWAHTFEITHLPIES